MYNLRKYLHNLLVIFSKNMDITPALTEMELDHKPTCETVPGLPQKKHYRLVSEKTKV